MSDRTIDRIVFGGLSIIGFLALAVVVLHQIGINWASSRCEAAGGVYLKYDVCIPKKALIDTARLRTGRGQ